jgi:hypothetical protein
MKCVLCGSETYKAGKGWKGKQKFHCKKCNYTFVENPSKRWKKWSKYEVEKLKELLSEGLTQKQIAQVLSRTHKSVIGKAKQLGLRTNPNTLKNMWREFGKFGWVKRPVRKTGRLWTKEEIEKLRMLYFNGTPVVEIAKQLNRTPSAIHLQLVRHKIRREISNVKKGVIGEEKAEKIMVKLGWKIVERGHRQAPYDFLVERNGQQCLVDVKSGSRYINIKVQTLQKLLETGKPFFIFYHNSDYIILFEPEIVEVGKKG